MSQELINVWENIKKDYLEGNYKTILELAGKWNVSYNTLIDKVHRPKQGFPSWKDQRKAMEDEVKSHAVEQAKKHLSTTYCKTSGMMDIILDRIGEGLERGVYTSRELPDLYAKLGTALKNVHSTLRLEDGKSTQNIAVGRKEINTDLRDALSSLKEKGLISSDELEIEISE